ncbi:MAG TPA: hypothetical protein VLF94_00140 [Chlamydiales bacterium]|nr:hypothetical protein [Chlamydiales bacterium]
MVYLPGVTSTGGISVASSAVITFSNIVQQAPGSLISLNTTNGNITIATTGFFQITFGASTILTAIATTSNLFQLQLAGASGTPYQTLDYQGQISRLTYMSHLTTIVQITTNPTVLTAVNLLANTVLLNNTTQTTNGGPAAYITILQIR